MRRKSPKSINYKQRLLESYKDMERDNINFKLAKVKVPKFDCVIGNYVTGVKTLDKPLYAVEPNTPINTKGADKGTCYDDSIAYKLEGFLDLEEAKAIEVYIKVSIPLYNELSNLGIIID